MHVLCLYVCAPYVCGAHGSEKKVVDALELWIIVSFRVDAGITPESSARAVNVLHRRAISPSANPFLQLFSVCSFTAL